MTTTRHAELVTLIADNNVEVIVVGMLAGVLQGVPVTTQDVDVVHRRTPENVQRLLTVLRQIDAIFRHDERLLRPNESHLIGPGHCLLETKLGHLDCLGAIDNGKTYEDLLDKSVAMELEGGTIRVLELRTLIEIKRRAGRPKDLAVIPYLESTLAEIERLSAG